MTLDEAKEKLKDILAEATENEDAVCYVTSDDADVLKAAIQVLEQESILDKIKAEFEDLDRFYDNDYFSGNNDAMFKVNEVIEILDKYKLERSDAE